MKRTLFLLALSCHMASWSEEMTWLEFFRVWGEFNAYNRSELFKQNKNNFDTSGFDSYNAANTQQSSPSNSLTLNDLQGAVPQAVFDLKDFIENAEKFDAMGAKPPKGILLVGPPGTGKTTLARALARELNVPLISASASQFVEIYVGTGPKRVRELFAQAKEEMADSKARHAIIFIDEIDAIGKRSEFYGGSSEDHKTLNELLTQMDGFSQCPNITVIAATNCPQVLDPALLRPGRFDEIITIDLPNREQRKQILKMYLYNAKFKRSSSLAINLDELAQKTQGWSGAELESIANKAAIIAVRKKHETIHYSDINEAYEEVKAMRSTRK